MPLFDFKCPKCSNWKNDVFVRSDTEVKCDLCDSAMEKLPPLVAPAVFTAGRSAESRAEWGAKQQARLHKRSLEYDNSPKGKQERQEQVAKLRANGTIPEGWSA